MGVCAGGLGAAVWSGLDWAGKADATPVGMAALVGGAAAVGASIGACLRIQESALRASVDRRAGLENRLTASVVDVPFVEEIRADASARLESVRSATLYPMRFGRWHGGALAAMALATSIFLLGSTPLLLSSAAKAERAAMAKTGQAVERITRTQFETPEAQKEMSEGERLLAQEARKLQRDLEKGRMSREEAMQKANDLEKKAQDLAKQAAGESQRSLADAETAMDKMERATLEKAGLGGADPALLQMPQGQKEMLQKRNAAEQAEIKKAMAAIDKRLAEIAKKLAQKGLSEAERKTLEAERKSLEAKKSELERQAERAKKEGDALKLSDEARSTLDKMRNHELMKEIRKLAEQMQKSNAQAAKTGQPQLTPEQRADMKKRLEALLTKLKDDAAMKEYLEQMIEAMKNGMLKAGQCERPGALGAGLMALLGIRGNGIGDDGLFADTGHVNRLDKPEEGKGKTFETQISGARRETGEETFVEIKAPTTVGNRTSVPYRQVLPSYRKKAEEALGRKEIPKDQEKRVRQYFESLTKG